jgi:hypothetical protein
MGGKRSSKKRTFVIATGMAICLLSVALVTVGQVASASPIASAHNAGADAPIQARVTGDPILGTAGWRSISASAAAPSPVPSKSGQIKVLAAALKLMKDNYAKFAKFTPGPQDIFDYGIGSLWLKGIDGAGTTVAVIEGWDDPAIAQTVASFDQNFGLPNPVIQTIFPSGDGKLPAKCPPGMVKLGSYGSCRAWRGELTLDVLSVHLIAPYAKILISATPADSQTTDDAASQVAPPEMMEAFEYIANHHLANVITDSDGSGEASYSYGDAEILAQDPGEIAAAAAGIPVLVATGDCGVVQNLPVANGQCEDVSSTPDTGTWDDSPWVTAVGGSVPNLSPATGARLGPDPLWHVNPPHAQYSESAGFSSVFKRPAYQNGVASIIGSQMRSVPDIVMDAQDGTSEAAPLLAGVLALATQLNGGNVGPINEVLYQTLGPAGATDGVSDVVSGNDSSETRDGTVTVPGFVAGKGFDVASGWGTIFAPSFVPSLVAATRATQQDKLFREQALEQLKALEAGVHLSETLVPEDGSSYLFAQNFLPGHPIGLYVDGTLVTTLTANPLGAVTYMIDPAMIGLSAGTHTVALKSMLLDEKATLTVT